MIKAKDALDEEFSDDQDVDEHNKMLFGDPEIDETADQILNELDSKNRKIRQSVSSDLAERRKLNISGKNGKLQKKAKPKVRKPPKQGRRYSPQETDEEEGEEEDSEADKRKSDIDEFLESQK